MADKEVRALLCCAAAGLVAMGGAQSEERSAADAQQRMLDEVVVTAQRRQQSVQEIPLAVSAFDAGALDRLGISETRNISGLVPNFTAVSNVGVGTANTYSIRGLNNSESIATFDPPVGSYIDDIYVTRQSANNFTLFDVDRIEVLRGPQGTLFGRNTTGGAVNVIMARPSPEFGGYAEIGYGRFNRKSVRAGVDLPISDSFLTKVAAYWIDDDGWLFNQNTGEQLNFEKNRGVRVDLRWLPSETVTWDFSADAIDTKDSMMPGTPVGGRFVSNTGLRKGGNISEFVDLTGGKSFIETGNRAKSWSLTSRVTVDTQIGEIEFLTGYRDLDHRYLIDFLDNPAPFGGFLIVFDGKHEQFSQEIKLTGGRENLEYVTGAFFLSEDNRSDFADVFNLGFPALISDRTLENKTETWAVYAQADYALTERLTTTVGARYTSDIKRIAIGSNQPNFVGATFDTQGLVDAGVPVRQRTNLLTPRVALQYFISDEINVYGSMTRGFKSGGWNARNNNPELITDFGPEVVWAYELGLRSQWFDNALRLNANLFWTDVSDFQLPGAVQDSTGGISFLTGNFADMEIKGLEVEALAVPTDRLTVYVNVGLQSSKYTSLSEIVEAQRELCLTTGAQCNQGVITPDGEVADPVRTPRFTLAAGGDYRIPVGRNIELVPAVQWVRYGHQQVGTSNPPGSKVDAYSNLNASISLEDLTANWRLRLECANCSNSVQQNSLLAGVRYYNPPRTWNASLQLGF